MITRLHDIKRLLAAMVLTTVVAFGAMAQVDAAFSHTWIGQGYYNPAAAGEFNAIHLTLGSRMQWVDFKHAPMSFYLTADMPYKLLEQQWGVGVKAEFERIGLYTNTRIGAQLAYKRKFGKKTLSVGVQPGIFSQTFRGHEIITTKEQEMTPDEAIKKEDVSGTVFDANVGVFFSAPHYWVGASVTHVTAPSIELRQTRESIDYYEFDISRGYYFMAGGNIPIKNTLFELMPSMMFKTDLNFWQAEATARVRYNKFLSAGVGYRYQDALSVQIGAEFKNFFIGYNYDWPLTEIRVSGGSHEVFVSYNVKLDMGEKNRNSHKSIRIM